MTEQEKKTLLINAGKGALDILRTVEIDEKVRRAIKRLEIALAVNGIIHKGNST